LDELTTRWQAACRHSDQFRREKYQNLFGRLRSLNPASVLKRGYAVIRVEDGSSIRSIRQVVNGQHLEVEVTDGTFDVQVNSSTQAH
jgi:exodeoxyribonuclease VII large subunit